ncbi:MAG: hypothetical protein RLY50_1045, partial [Actinomycetota bacterium]
MRRAFTALSWAVAAVGVALAAAHASGSGTGATPDATATAALIFAGLACFAGAVVHRLPARAWIFTPAIVAGIAIARAIDLEKVADSAPSTAPESLLIASQIVLAAGLVAVARRRLADRAASVIADGLIVGLGAWVLAWVLIVHPSLADSPATGIEPVLRSATLALAIVVVALLSVVLFSDAAPSPALSFASTAVALQVAGMIVRALALREGNTIGREWIDAPLVAACAAAAAALLHPSVRILTVSGRMRQSSPLMARLVATTAALVAPVITLAVTDAADQSDRWVRTVSSAVLAAVVMARVVQSVRANESTQEQLVRGALTDSLTGLPNRTLMLRHIDTALRASWGTPRQPTVLFIDVDRFKNINDSLGHSIGDDVLSGVASRLIAAVPDHAVVGRIAGDEFVVLDDRSVNATESVMLAERVLDAFRDPIGTVGPDMFVTASVGVAYAPAGLEIGADALMRHADTAMYRAKDAGRNCIALFDDSMVAQVTQRLDIETALYRALERNELRLVHQPIVDVSLGLVVGFESLMRWERDGSAVSPDEFIPVAEDTGTIVPLGGWALRDSLAQLRTWIDSGVCKPSTTINVNVSPRQLHDPQFVQTVVDALAATGVPADQLWLEVTEGVMITDTTQALSALRRLESIGVRIAIDDFGTGYSSLSLLQRFPIHCVKVDRTFVNDIDDPGTQSIVRTIVAMAATLGAEVVAEGVETTAQLDVLSSLGCHLA